MTISAATLEEAPVRYIDWHKQRTRWMKGHMQTWMVLMRHPGRIIADLGLWKFLLMQGAFGGSLLASCLHLPFVIWMLLGFVFPFDRHEHLAGHAVSYRLWRRSRRRDRDPHTRTQPYRLCDTPDCMAVAVGCGVTRHVGAKTQALCVGEDAAWAKDRPKRRVGDRKREAGMTTEMTVTLAVLAAGGAADRRL